MVNAADGETVRISPLLLETVAASLRAARLTDGDVDPTVGEALMALGYDRDYALVGAAEPRRIQIVPVPGWRTIKLDPEDATIRLARGVRLDLGATAKALAADHAAAAATRRGLRRAGLLRRRHRACRGRLRTAAGASASPTTIAPTSTRPGSGSR